MGNLCSSGTERTDKKEENKVPDKPREGEDEVLLPTDVSELGIGPDGVQVLVENEGGGGGSGFGGILSGAVKSGESAFTDVTRSAQVEGQKTAAAALQSGEEVATGIVEDVQTRATAAVTETAASVRATAEKTVAQGVADVERKATEAFHGAAGKLEETVEGVKSQFGAGGVVSGVTNAVDSAKSDVDAVSSETENWSRSNVERSATSVVQDARYVAASTAGSVKTGVESVNRDVNTFQSETASGLESAISRSEDLKSGAETAAGERTSSSPAAQNSFFGNVTEEFGKKTDEIKATAESVAEAFKQTAENKANEAVESAKLSASETVATWTETATQKVSELTGNVSSVSQTAPESADSFEKAQNVQGSTEATDEELQQAAFRNTAENKLGEFESFISGKSAFRDAQQSVATQAHDVERSAEGVNESVDKSVITAESDLQQTTSQQLQNLQLFSENITQNAQNSATSKQTSLEQHFDDIRDYVQDVTAAASQKAQELDNKVVDSFRSAQETAATTVEEVETGSLLQNISNVEQEVSSFEGRANNITEQTGESTDSSETAALSDYSSNRPQQQEESSGLFSGIQESFRGAVKTGEEYLRDNVVNKVEGLVEGIQEGEAEEERASPFNASQQSAAPPETTGSDEDFLDKAKSLLEAHRNSIDGGKLSVPSVSITQEDDEESGENSEQTADSENASHEATAREFVESIIEKATSLVSESLEQNEPASEISSPSDPCVDRGEETLAPKKRGVMFVSPQTSDRSSSSLSSPLELSPPPHESDLSPPGESSGSSISQSDLVEADELLIPPPLPAEYSISESNNNNNNIINNNVEDDDESIQRVAMEVTAKAVQDAIKIVSENGTGSILTSNILSNDLGISSPSSLENDEEEITTTDSSQVERGSPVSDITDTSAHGSVSESLSSYDPGAVFRQDVANTSDLAVSPGDNSAEVEPQTQWAQETSRPTGKTVDLINFEDGSATHAETPTPTNAASFDTYPHPPSQVSSHEQRESETNPSTFPSEVPSSLSFPVELSSSPSKPTIIINSPDSAHHTNGSSEDVSPQAEALI